MRTQLGDRKKTSQLSGVRLDSIWELTTSETVPGLETLEAKRGISSVKHGGGLAVITEREMGQRTIMR